MLSIKYFIDRKGDSSDLVTYGVEITYKLLSYYCLFASKLKPNSLDVTIFYTTLI